MTTCTPVRVEAPDLTELAASHGEKVKFRRGDVIFTSGNPADELYIISHGKVKISLDGPADWGSLLTIHGPADVFGEWPVFDPGPWAATAIALTDVEAVSIGHGAVRAGIRERPGLAEWMLRLLARQVRRSHVTRADLVFTDVPGRIAKALLLLARRFGVPEGRTIRVVHDLTQKELAQHIGATRETVNKVLVHFVERGWLQVEPYSVLILQPERLARRARLVTSSRDAAEPDGCEDLY